MTDITLLSSIELRLVRLEQPSEQPALLGAEQVLALRTDFKRCAEHLSLEADMQVAALSTRLNALTFAAATQLRQECVAFVIRYPKLPEAADLDLFEREVRQHLRKLDLLSQLSPELQLDPQMARDERAIKALADRLDAASAIKDLVNHVRTQREVVDRLDKIYPSQALQIAKDLWNQVCAFIERKVATSGDEVDRVFQMRQETEQLYDDLRQRHEIPLTRQAGGEFVETVIYFSELAEKQPNASVTYPASAELSAQPRSMTAQEAVKIARQQLLRRVWQKAVEGYVQSAHALLNEHKPREAQVALNAWRNLPGLNDDRVGMSLGGNLEAMIRSAQDPIDKDLTLLTRAEEFIRDAKRAFDPVIAQQALDQAQQTYEYVPGITELQVRVASQANEQFSRLTQDLERAVQSEDWGGAETLLRMAGDLSKAFPRSIDAVAQNNYNRVRRVYEDVRKSENLKGDEKLDQLIMLRDTYQETYWPGWPRLQRDLTTMAARGDLDELKKRLQGVMTDETSMLVLNQLSQEIQEILDAPPVGISESDRKSLTGAPRKLSAWLGFARARDELARINASSGLSQDGQSVDVPDLQVVRAALDQAQQDADANHIAQSLRLPERLAELQRNDTEVQANLDRINAQVYAPNLSLSTAERLHAEISHLLGQPTSYRRPLLNLRRQIADIIVTHIRDEAQQLIDAARPGFFQSLNVSLITRRLSTVRRLGLSSMDELYDLIKLPQHIAGIYAFEQEAQARDDWEHVRTEWRTVADLARAQSELFLAKHCESQADNAYRAGRLCELQALQHDTSETVELRYEALTRDLADDSRVWLAYGSYLLRRLKASIRQHSESVRDMTLAGRARNALERAQTLDRTANPPNLSFGNHGSISDMIEDLRLWERLGITLQVITQKLKTAIWLAVPEAEEAQRAYRECLKTLRDLEQRSILEQAWSLLLQDARPRLDLAERDTDLFKQLETLLCLICLFPEEQQWSLRLRNRLMNAISQFRHDVAAICNDPSAGRFIQRRAAVGGQSILDREVLTMQYSDINLLMERIQILRLALDRMPETSQLAELRMISLDEDASRIEEDLACIQEARAACEKARRAADGGLLNPDDLQRALFILRQSTSASFQLAQIPEMFKDQGHPTYRDALNYVRGLQRLRNQQEQLKAKLERCLREYAHITNVAQMPDPATITALDQRELALEIREGLSRHGRPRYPIEIALRYLEQIQQGDPDDRCGLHDTLCYEDTDDSGRKYQGLSVLQRTLGRKALQITALFDLLDQVHTMPHDGDLQCLGIVDWPKEWSRLLAWLERDPYSSQKVLKAVALIRKGDQAGLCEVGNPSSQRWSLQMASRTLERQAALSYINQRLELAGYEPIGTTALCAAARRLDLDRAERLGQLEMHMEDTMKKETLINQRVILFQSSLDRFLTIYHRVAARHPGKRNPREDSEYLSAVDDLYKLFPGWQDFLEKIADVAKKHPHLRPHWYHQRFSNGL